MELCYRSDQLHCPTGPAPLLWLAALLVCGAQHCCSRHVLATRNEASLSVLKDHTVKRNVLQSPVSLLSKAVTRAECLQMGHRPPNVTLRHAQNRADRQLEVPPLHSLSHAPSCDLGDKLRCGSEVSLTLLISKIASPCESEIFRTGIWAW